MTAPTSAPAVTVPGCPHIPQCPAADAVTDMLGADLHVGSVVVDIKGAAHRIDRISEYPGRRFIGDHARVAYGDGWEHTIGDHEHFHCLRDEEMTDDAVRR